MPYIYIYIGTIREFGAPWKMGHENVLDHQWLSRALLDCVEIWHMYWCTKDPRNGSLAENNWLDEWPQWHSAALIAAFSTYVLTNLLRAWLKVRKSRTIMTKTATNG